MRSQAFTELSGPGNIWGPTPDRTRSCAERTRRSLPGLPRTRGIGRTSSSQRSASPPPARHRGPRPAVLHPRRRRRHRRVAGRLRGPRAPRPAPRDVEPNWPNSSATHAQPPTITRRFDCLLGHTLEPLPPPRGAAAPSVTATAWPSRRSSSVCRPAGPEHLPRPHLHRPRLGGPLPRHHPPRPRLPRPRLHIADLWPHGLHVGGQHVVLELLRSQRFLVGARLRLRRVAQPGASGLSSGYLARGAEHEHR